jgi:folate-binding protein YgfZ
MADPAPLAALYARIRKSGGVIDLSDRAKWHLAGADRVRYLNGQVSNDMRRVSAAAALQACVTTAKGRLSGVIFVSAAESFLRIDADAALRESLGARLERYIISDDAALEDATDEECLFHVLGSTAPEDCPGAEIRTAGRFGKGGYDVIVPTTGRDRALAALLTHRPLIPDALAEPLRIEAGAPRWGAELTEETLPPEAGLDRVAIDYHKGCYIGQEVISRIKSVGHVNRELMGLTAAAPLAPGMTLHPRAEMEKNAGEITSAAWSFGLETWAALGYVKRGHADGALCARSPDGAAIEVQVRPLPLIP